MKTVLITGVNKSIGLETARQLAEQGHFIYLGRRDLANGHRIVAQLVEAGLPHVSAIQLPPRSLPPISSRRTAPRKRCSMPTP